MQLDRDILPAISQNLRLVLIENATFNFRESVPASSSMCRDRCVKLLSQTVWAFFFKRLLLLNAIKDFPVTPSLCWTKNWKSGLGCKSACPIQIQLYPSELSFALSPASIVTGKEARVYEKRSRRKRCSYRCGTKQRAQVQSLLLIASCRLLCAH